MKAVLVRRQQHLAHDDEADQLARRIDDVEIGDEGGLDVFAQLFGGLRHSQAGGEHADRGLHQIGDRAALAGDGHCDLRRGGIERLD